MNPQRKKDDILELIPNDKLSAEQKAFRLNEGEEGFPIYKMLREPSCINDFDLEKESKISIRLDNGTLICIGSMAFAQYDERKLYFWIYDYSNEGNDSTCYTIYGKTDAVIAETAIFFWSLTHPEGCLSIRSRGENNFDVAALHPEQLAQILDANPKRSLSLGIGIWTAEQSVVLATRPYPLDLTLYKYFMDRDKFAFQDEGTAFVDALEKRRSSFGALELIWDSGSGEIPFSSDNQRRLFTLEVFETLKLRSLDKELALLPFATKVNALEYEVDSVHVQPEDFESLEIAAKHLHLRIYFSSGTSDWDAILISFFKRVGQMGQLERLEIFPIRDDEEPGWWGGFDDIASIAETLICAINGNPKLSYLDIGHCDSSLDFEPHLSAIFKAMEEHKGLTTFTLRYAPEEMTSPVYPALEQLLKRNRNITVFDRNEKRCSNGPRIEELYSLNKCYNGSASLVKVSASLRPSLVATALAKNASRKFQHTALLLANHTDVLCEFIDGADLDSVADVQLEQEETIHRVPKRRGAQPPRAAKKAPRNEKM